MSFRKAIIIYAISFVIILLALGVRLFSWQSLLYLAILFMIGYSFIALFYGYKKWKASGKASFMAISGLGILLFIFLAIILPPWLFPYQDDVVDPQAYPAVTRDYWEVQYPSHQVGSEVVSGWGFSVTLHSELNVSKNVVI